MAPHTIAVAGKGGVGKTTTCGMLIDYLCKKKKGPVLVVDADANSTLRMSYGLEQDVTAEVLCVGPEEGGKQVVVLRCRDYLSQVTQLRRQSGELVMDSHTGLRIPANALRLNEEGQSGVYCMVGYTAKFKPVTVTYQGDGYTLVEPAEGATGSQILRPGDEVIVTASDLYDGKVVA